jgi:hypothetical protein
MKPLAREFQTRLQLVRPGFTKEAVVQATVTKEKSVSRVLTFEVVTITWGHVLSDYIPCSLLGRYKHFCRTEEEDYNLGTWIEL